VRAGHREVRHRVHWRPATTSTRAVGLAPASASSRLGGRIAGDFPTESGRRRIKVQTLEQPVKPWAVFRKIRIDDSYGSLITGARPKRTDQHWDKLTADTPMFGRRVATRRFRRAAHDERDARVQARTRPRRARASATSEPQGTSSVEGGVAWGESVGTSEHLLVEVEPDVQRPGASKDMDPRCTRRETSRRAFGIIEGEEGGAG